MEIPYHLKKQLFVKVLKGTKKAFETDWQNNGYKASEIISWIKQGNNYGVLCGINGLVVIDFDNIEFYNSQSVFFPDTFETLTGSGKYHKYFYCYNLDGNATIKDPDTGEHCGELRYSRLQAVAPGSIHPDTGKEYKVHKDLPIASIDAKELMILFGKYIVNFTKNKDEGFKDAISDIGISPLIKGLKLTKKGNEWQGTHPIHGSSTGNNFSINTEKNVWYCFRHNIGGFAPHLVAVLEGLISCEDVHKLKGIKYKQAVDLAKEKYGIVFKEKEKEQSLELAEKFLEKYTVIFCEENGTFYIYEDGYYKTISEIDLNKLFLEIPEWEKLSLNKINDITKRIKVLTGKHLEDLNKELYLNLNNGIYDIDQEQLIEHTPEILSTIRLPYNYKKETKCPLWKEFLKQSVGPEHRIETLQEFLGYCLTKDTRFEMALCMTSDGRSGKGVVTHVLQELIGRENISNLGLEYFSDTQMLKMLVNKMVNISEEVRENAINFDAEFKKITVGEYISVNQKYVDVYEFKPFCKLILNINTFPKINDKSRAFYERILVIPFDRTFNIEERDSTLKERLVREELSGILNWVLEGQKRLYKRGRFEINEEMTDFIKGLRRSNNPSENFVEDELERNDDYKTYKDDIYTIYKRWCGDNGHHHMANTTLCRTIYKYFNITPGKNDRDTNEPRRRFIHGIKFINYNKSERVNNPKPKEWAE